MLFALDKIGKIWYSFVGPKRNYSLNIRPMNRLHRFASYALLGTASALYILAGDPALSFEPDRNGYSGENHYVNVCVEKEDVNRCYNNVPYNDPDLIRFTQKYNPEEPKRIPWLSDARDNGTLAKITLCGWIGANLTAALVFYVIKKRRGSATDGLN